MGTSLKDDLCFILLEKPFVLKLRTLSTNNSNKKTTSCRTQFSFSASHCLRNLTGFTTHFQEIVSVTEGKLQHQRTIGKLVIVHTLWNINKSISKWCFTMLSKYSLTLSQTSPGFHVSAVHAFWKHCGKGEIARNEQFLLFPQYFLPILGAFCHFHQIWNCRLQALSVWKRLKFVVWERVKLLLHNPDFKQPCWRKL